MLSILKGVPYVNEEGVSYRKWRWKLGIPVTRTWAEAVAIPAWLVARHW